MTQSRSHRSPLAPGEIRTHTVGARTFQVLHVAGGSMTQASYRDERSHSTVLCTDVAADVAVKAYADAIQRAEDAADLSYNLPMGADMRLVTGEDTQPLPAPVTPLEAIAVLRRWADFQPPHVGDAVTALETLIKDTL